MVTGKDIGALAAVLSFWGCLLVIALAVHSWKISEAIENAGKACSQER